MTPVCKGPPTKSDIRKNIRRYGCFIFGVFSEDERPGFAYTVGNRERGLPEFLAIGTHRGDFLNAVSAKLIKTGRTRFTNGEIVDLGGKWPVKVIDANATAQAEYTIQASTFYDRDDYLVQQVLIPDRSGRFPDNRECDAHYRFPVLGHAPPN
jgi:hypothetical protein